MTLSGHVLPDATVEEYGYGLGPPTGLLVLRYRHAAGMVLPETRDDHVHQLYWSPEGALALRRGGTTVYAGPQQGVWVQRGFAHEVSAVSGRSLLRLGLRQVPEALRHLQVGTVDLAADACRAVLDVARAGVAEETGLAARAALFAGVAAAAGGEAPRGDHGAGFARAVARAIAADPADPTTLEEWARRLHTSVKTLQRDFVREFGTSYSAWRARQRLEASLALLPTLPVNQTAHRVGYASVSAFVSAFTREFGETPGVRSRRLRPR